MSTMIEPPDQFISIARAAEIAGLSPKTLRHQAVAGKLQTVKLAHDLLTTRRFLHSYLTQRDDSRGATPLPLPEGYQAPE
jgi:hypothetical protein